MLRTSFATPPLIEHSVVPSLATVLLMLAGWQYLTLPNAPAVSPTGEQTLQNESALPMRVDLNRTDSRELAILPGIGPKLAEGLLRRTNQNGAFQNWTEVDQVEGLGKTTLAIVRQWCRLDS